MRVKVHIQDKYNDHACTSTAAAVTVTQVTVEMIHYYYGL